MSRIVGVSAALPPNSYAQTEITAAIAPMITQDASKQALLRRLHEGSRVERRHLVQPIERYLEGQSFTTTNGIFIEAATDLAEEALTAALMQAGIAADEVDFVLFTSVTGVSAPSIDALLVPRIGLRPDVKRVPMFGLGCVAGAAGIARVDDYLAGHPMGVAVLISVELCSLTVQRGDDSMANLVASGLFGDGAAAVVMVGSERAAQRPDDGFDIIAARSALYPDTRHVLGFNPGETGFRIVLTAGVADVVDEHFGTDMTQFLADNGTTVGGIGRWVAHPGGPRVLDAFSDALRLPSDALDASWDSLARVGNLSSASVLHVLADSIRDHPPVADELCALFALGPGVCAELVLMRWSGDSK
ncbi:isopalmitoylresorcinol synthase [Agreia bicolorata]|uniref:Isopalmitoylresorcinol synthase n=1 Tax=Agreia bicolorata TaxID=110935 RepID=A0A1T4YHU0_9MICO|nr:3-oxoacyl-[acyl-carrier-protein] synthase III C-terminal domain-containing protein [Agreia bicolorata]SKB01138.1 isopalmitoylresorcinol synthase [Agreia bicolorata]